MRKVSRDDLLETPLYERERDAVRQDMMKQKKVRRVHVGDTLTFLFENADTVRYQVQEMIRAEGSGGKKTSCMRWRRTTGSSADPGRSESPS